MKTSPYLQQMVFFEQNPVTDQLFEARSGHLFQDPGKSAVIEVHEQLPRHLRALNESSLSDSKSEAGHFPVPPTPVDRCPSLDNEPPRYDGLSGLVKHDVADEEELKRITSVRSHRALQGTAADTDES